MSDHSILVLGASAGGVEALTKLVAQLPVDLPAAVFVAMHTTASDPGYLAPILERAGPLSASLADDGEPIRHGHIFVAPPDYHLLVKEGYVQLSHGPRENRARPAIDVLFRSAAVSYTSQVIGVLLTGLLDDGTAGLWAIKQCGGLTIAQDPTDAAYPDMPQSAIDHDVVDYVVSVAEMGTLLGQLVRIPVDDSPQVPDDLLLEARFVEHVHSSVAHENRIGQLAPQGCPECGGPLWQIDSSLPLRYRCHMGHGYTSRTLLAGHTAAVEQSLWVAIRSLEEQAQLLKTMVNTEQQQNRPDVAELFAWREAEARSAIQVLSTMLTTYTAPTPKS